MTWINKHHGSLLLDPPLAEDLFQDPFGKLRRRMIMEHLWGRDIRDRQVIEAMARVPRHRFVEEQFYSAAYEDSPLGIGHGQTISQPYMVAKMIELAQVCQGCRVLDVGVGSGYQSAVLLALGAEVFGVEIVEELACFAEERLCGLGYTNFTILCRDGFTGLPDRAPYDAILLAAAPEEIPAPLLEQLASGGRLVAPLGPLDDQHLHLFTRSEEGVACQSLFPVRFVPMTGRAQSESPR